jgi:uncharacterized protein
MPDSYFHGERHWRRVALIGLHLLSSVEAADPLVVFLFALFHDSMRENEDRDRGHGGRGGDLGMELIPKYLDASDLQLDEFKDACDHHTGGGGKTSSDPTIGVCWDSDRLDRWRVGSKPSPDFMSTPLARQEETIEWTLSLLDIEPPEWTELATDIANKTRKESGNP